MAKVKVEEIGSCAAIIKSIKTTIDGGFNISLDINPNDEQLISKLMRKFANGDKLIEIGIVAVND